VPCIVGIRDAVGHSACFPGQVFYIWWAHVNGTIVLRCLVFLVTSSCADGSPPSVSARLSRSTTASRSPSRSITGSRSLSRAGSLSRSGSRRPSLSRSGYKSRAPSRQVMLFHCYYSTGTAVTCICSSAPRLFGEYSAASLPGLFGRGATGIGCRPVVDLSSKHLRFVE
jgi:hypothetical protein